MVSVTTFKKLALSFPHSVEQPHFEKTSFRVNKKIFATLSTDGTKAVFKLSAIDQSVYCSTDRTIFSPVDNKWGKQGWTVVDLGKVTLIMLKEVLNCAYREVTKNNR